MIVGYEKPDARSEPEYSLDIWTYQNEKMENIYSGSISRTGIASYYRTIKWTECQGKYYLCTDVNDSVWKTMVNGKFKTIMPQYQNYAASIETSGNAYPFELLSMTCNTREKLGMTPIDVKQTVANGNCTESLKWSLDTEGLLRIYGTGNMPEYDKDADIPWTSMRNKIKTVAVEEGVTSLTSSAFRACANLKTAYIGEGIENLSSDLFRDCGSLVNVELPKSLKNISMYAFGDCNSLDQIVIPENVENIGTLSFYGCSKLWSVIFLGDAPQIGSKAFAGVEASISYYYDTSGWNSIIGNEFGGTLSWYGGNIQ